MIITLDRARPALPRHHVPDESDLLADLAALDDHVTPPSSPYAVVLVQLAPSPAGPSLAGAIDRLHRRVLVSGFHRLYRVGPHELAVLVPSCEHESADEIARRVRMTLTDWECDSSWAAPHMTVRAAWADDGRDACRGGQLWWAVRGEAERDLRRPSA
jgi:hypothetical protein